MIGIVGGVGPLAALDIATKIIEETLTETEQDHLPVLLHSQPQLIVDRAEYLLGKVAENPAYAIANSILELEKEGATVVAMPCHAAHAPRIFEVVEEELVKAGSRVRLLHLVEETAQFIQHEGGVSSVGILATAVTKNSGLYRNSLSKHDLQAIEPDEELQARIEAAIADPTYGIRAVSSPVSNRARQEIINAITDLKKAGAQSIIMGGTEFNLALHEKESDGLPLIDPNRILARALIREFALNKLRGLSI
ncbi:aspartate/glutamate racemase family protein [Sphingobacterium deserti]|uniref:Aspartate racemase n=1 Tax=Sphingobacterium deserti TaxID=1229276 RepID=A0A0B8T1F8_9SPHI|nr:amino acid racemase [Sphingobacterium deserti]KGE14772.1 aspartate racemase [Sphingobacterium deserti]